jgi:acyl-CoA reductase-like NAD-dependent aldehyde dehydrogenase
MTRIPVVKTLKMYVGGQFIRSESGHTVLFRSASGGAMYACKASRKDLKDAVEVARAAQAGWAQRTPYNRGQILYRMGEMIEDRRETLGPEAEAAADRALHHAGWADKIGAVLSTLNPVAGAWVNYSQMTPTGIVVAVPHADDGLLGLVESVCTPLLMGNAVVVLARAEAAETVARFAEVLATSDVPAGVVGLLTCDVNELTAWVGKFDDIDTLMWAEGSLPAETATEAERAAGRTMRRVVRAPRASVPADPVRLAQLGEVRTVWIGV